MSHVYRVDDYHRLIVGLPPKVTNTPRNDKPTIDDKLKELSGDTPHHQGDAHHQKHNSHKGTMIDYKA